MMIVNAKLFTMDENDQIIENGYIKFSDGIITDVGDMNELNGKLDEKDVINANGYHVYPGMVDAHTHLGMFGDSVKFEGDDGNEDTDPSTPHLRAIDAINPMDRYFTEAIKAGVTTVLTGPGSANPVAGQIAAIKTYGKRIDNMIIKAPVGIKFALGENPKSTYNDKEQTPVTRMATAAIIRETLAKAKKYCDDKDKYVRDKENYDCPEFDMKNEAMIPLIKKEIPAHFHAHRADDIFTAIRISKEFDIDYVLVHGTEGHLITDELKKESLRGVLSGPILTDRSKPELSNQSALSPAILSKNGILTGIITDHPETPIQYLSICAAVANKEGMDETEALRSVTITPSRICGIDERVGSLETGKDADIIIYSGNLLDIRCKPLVVIIEGNVIINNICE